MAFKTDKINKLVESILQEVRLPTGYFTVLKRFTVQASEKEWSTVFMQNELVQMDPNNNTVKGFTSNKTWELKDISFNELRKPENYKIFSQNTRRLTPQEVIERGFGDTVEFNTTVRALPRRVQEFDLSPSTKINVKVVESIEIDLEKGDTILAGKFKNKKTIVKDIGTDELNQPTINNKSILKFRIPKLMNKEENKLDANKMGTSKPAPVASQFISELSFALRDAYKEFMENMDYHNISKEDPRYDSEYKKTFSKLLEKQLRGLYYKYTVGRYQYLNNLSFEKFVQAITPIPLESSAIEFFNNLKLITFKAADAVTNYLSQFPKTESMIENKDLKVKVLIDKVLLEAKLLKEDDSKEIVDLYFGYTTIDNWGRVRRLKDEEAIHLLTHLDEMTDDDYFRDLHKNVYRAEDLDANGVIIHYKGKPVVKNESINEDISGELIPGTIYKVFDKEKNGALLYSAAKLERINGDFYEFILMNRPNLDQVQLEISPKYMFVVNPNAPKLKEEEELEEKSTTDQAIRPKRMAPAPDINGMTKSATAYWNHLYIQDEAEDIFQDKYGDERGTKNWEGSIEAGGGAMYQAVTSIVMQKAKMYRELREELPSDYFSESWFSVWKRWVAAKGKPYTPKEEPKKEVPKPEKSIAQPTSLKTPMPVKSAPIKRSNNFDFKDEQRIADIMTKANGNRGKAQALAQQMANSITDKAKALRRANAAESDNYHDLANIFLKRYITLGGK